MAMQGDDLKAIRTRIGMTQAQFADALGMSMKSIGMMERGEAAIELRTELATRYLAGNHDIANGVSAAITGQGEAATMNVQDIGARLVKDERWLRYLATELRRIS